MEGEYRGIPRVRIGDDKRLKVTGARMVWPKVQTWRSTSVEAALKWFFRARRNMPRCI